MTICPSTILGEIIGSGENTSASMISKLLLNQMPGIPPVFFPTIDVKDCALAHLRGLERPAAANKRFILSDKTGLTMIELADTLQEGLTEAGYGY